MDRDDGGDSTWAILLAGLLALVAVGGGFLYVTVRNERDRATAAADEAARVAHMEAEAARANAAAKAKASEK